MPCPTVAAGRRTGCAFQIPFLQSMPARNFKSLLDMKPALYRIAETHDVLIIVSFMSLGETMREGAR